MKSMKFTSSSLILISALGKKFHQKNCCSHCCCYDLYKRRLKNRLKTSMQMMTWEWSLAWRFKAAKKIRHGIPGAQLMKHFLSRDYFYTNFTNFFHNFFGKEASIFIEMVTHLWTDKEFPYCVLKKLVKSISFSFRGISNGHHGQ